MSSDLGYLGAEMREEHKEIVGWVIIMRQGQRRKMRYSETEEVRLIDQIGLLKIRFKPILSIRFTS